MSSYDDALCATSQTLSISVRMTIKKTTSDKPRVLQSTSFTPSKLHGLHHNWIVADSRRDSVECQGTKIFKVFLNCGNTLLLLAARLKPINCQ